MTQIEILDEIKSELHDGATSQSLMRRLAAIIDTEHPDKQTLDTAAFLILYVHRELGNNPLMLSLLSKIDSNDIIQPEDKQRLAKLPRHIDLFAGMNYQTFKGSAGIVKDKSELTSAWTLNPTGALLYSLFGQGPIDINVDLYQKHPGHVLYTRVPKDKVFYLWWGRNVQETFVLPRDIGKVYCIPTTPFMLSESDSELKANLLSKVKEYKPSIVKRVFHFLS